MIKTILLVGAGGFIGSVARLLMQLVIDRHIVISFPVGTLLINILGCLLIGIIYGMADKTALVSPEIRSFMVTGICGGFTTFSTFSYQCISLFKQENYAYGILYILGSILFCLLATLGGIGLVNALSKA